MINPAWVLLLGVFASVMVLQLWAARIYSTSSEVLRTLHRLSHEIPLNINNSTWTIVNSMLESHLRRDVKPKRFYRLSRRRQKRSKG